jgi:hypothetical protein
VQFRGADRALGSGAVVSAVYQVERSVYQGQVRVELRLEDLRAVG